MREHTNIGPKGQGSVGQQEDRAARLSRRDMLKAGGAIALGLTGVAATPDRSFGVDERPTTTPLDASLIRLATVRTISDGGLLKSLITQLQAHTAYRVAVYVGEDVYKRARAGKADLVFSHFGHKDAEAFITEGLGQWPRSVLFNQIALLLPARDPARVRGAVDPVHAFARIAHARAPFVVNNMEGLRYLTETLWYAAGRPAQKGWYLDSGLRGVPAMQVAAKKGGYTLWGVTPFLVSQKRNRLPLHPLLFDDPLFQRIMVSVVVNPRKFPGANVAGALAFQQYLLQPETQARIQTFRFPGIPQPLFRPAGRNNAPQLLPH